MIEAPLKLQEQLTLAQLPADHLAACAAAGVSLDGGQVLPVTFWKTQIKEKIIPQTT